MAKHEVIVTKTNVLYRFIQLRSCKADFNMLTYLRRWSILAVHVTMAACVAVRIMQWRPPSVLFQCGMDVYDQYPPTDPGFPGGPGMLMGRSYSRVVGCFSWPDPWTTVSCKHATDCRRWKHHPLESEGMLPWKLKKIVWNEANEARERCSNVLT